MQATMDEPTIDLDVLFEEIPPTDEEPPVSEWAVEEYGEDLWRNFPDPKDPSAEGWAAGVVEKILDSRARQERIKAAWKPRLTRESSREKGLLHTFGGWLGEFVKCRTKARKSVLLEVGTVGFRKKSQTLKILDPTGLALWALEKAPEIVTHTFKALAGGPSRLCDNAFIPSGAKVVIELLPGHDDYFVRSLHTLLSDEWRGNHTYEVKQADAQSYFERTGEVPFACELVPAHDDLYISDPRASK